jgi:hypothetical protein
MMIPRRSSSSLASVTLLLVFLSFSLISAANRNEEIYRIQLPNMRESAAAHELEVDVQTRESLVFIQASLKPDFGIFF